MRTPLYDWHVARGARMVDFAGWDMPIQYTTIIDEHQAVRTQAGLFDISHMGRLLFDGRDALDLIQHLYTNDAASMKVGQVRYGLVCNEKGGILDDVLVYRFSPSWLMVVNASNREKVLRWVEQHKKGRDVRVADATAGWAMIALQGPRALEVATAYLAGSEWKTDLAQAPVNQLKYYHAQLIPGESNAHVTKLLIVSRTGYTGEDGVELIVQAGRVVGLVDEVFKTAERLGVPLKPCGLGARDTLRLEAAMPLYGHELGEDIDPFQAGLGWAVKMDKGDFVGREFLDLRRSQPQRRRVGLELGGKRIAREGAVVRRDGRDVGLVTSGTFGPTVQKAIAMAYVDPEHARPGTACEAVVRGKPEPARVVPLPFYRRAK